MQTFDQALLYHVQAGRVAMEDALKAATHPHDFKLLVSSDGLRSTSVESVIDDDPRRSRRERRPPSVNGAPGSVRRHPALDGGRSASSLPGARGSNRPR